MLPAKDAAGSQKFASPTQGEDHVDGGLHLDRLVVEQVGPVAPLSSPRPVAACCNMAGPLTTFRSSIVPVLEMVACSTTVPDTRAALAIGG